MSVTVCVNVAAPLAVTGEPYVVWNDVCNWDGGTLDPPRVADSNWRELAAVALFVGSAITLVIHGRYVVLVVEIDECNWSIKDCG
jgi:hypothetical protein